MNRFVKKILFLLLSTLSIVQLGGCEYKKPGDHQDRLTFNNGETENYWGDHSSIEGNTSLDDDVEPNVTVTIIGGETKEDEISNEIEQKKITNIESLIYSSVQKNLEKDGFTVKAGVANIAEDEEYSSLGLYYYDEKNFKLFGNDTIRACGFVEVKKDTDQFYALSKEESMIYVIDAENCLSSHEMLALSDNSSDIESKSDAITNVCTYNYENIDSYHFVYQNTYVQYYQQTEMRVVYSTFDNKKANYDLSMGSLYDYDNDCYIYDESIFGEYTNHSGEALFSEEDYKKLKEEMKTFSDQQLANGYNVEEYQIVYISPESIQTYLNSKEEDTFFGYSVDELTEEFGLETALEFTGNGFKAAQVLTKEDKGYNWKSFLIKIGIGCGIILVGAILAPVTGGASFGCALLTISKVAVTYALTAAIGTIAIKAVESMIAGNSLTDTLKNMVYVGLDSFANNFMIGAAKGSIGVLSGIIKPSACFVAGTQIITSELGKTTSIENIRTGDYVWSYNQNMKTNSLQKVTDVFEKEVDELVDVKINDKVIRTTRNHPFYLSDYDSWVEAASLRQGDKVLTYDSGYQYVQDVNVYDCEPTPVYNFTVENNHTYYVSEIGVLVHNICENTARSKAVSKAWKKEQEAIQNGTSKYNWTDEQAAEILKNGKLKGYDGHHIVPVNEVRNTANSYLISDPDNIALISSHDHHTYVHSNQDYSFEKTAYKIVELLPWMAKKVAELGKLLG